VAQARWEAVESFTIITTEPNELVRPVHNRMPVLLRPEDEDQWLDVSRTPFVKAKSVLNPYPDELMDDEIVWATAVWKGNPLRLSDSKTAGGIVSSGSDICFNSPRDST
jgi:putative SOS response-associated peptidase YedK